MKAIYKFTILIFTVAAVVFLLILVLRPVVEEEVVTVDGGELPAEYTWNSRKPVTLHLVNIHGYTQVAFWCYDGSGNFSGIGEMGKKSVFVCKLSGNRTFNFYSPGKMRIERIERFQPLRIPDNNWEVHAELLQDYFDVPTVRVQCIPGFNRIYLDGDAVVYTTCGMNITGFARNSEVEAYFDGAIVRSTNGTIVSMKITGGNSGENESIDSDRDGVYDKVEHKIGLNPENPDCDNDSAADGLEIYWGTDPHSRDCDGDELDDGLELAFVPLYVRTSSEFSGGFAGFELPAEGIYKIIVFGADTITLVVNNTTVEYERIGNTAVYVFYSMRQNLTLGISGSFQSVSIEKFGIDPFNADTDNDGLNDSAEVKYNSSP
ncbi:MAG: hypothetical protein ACP5JR_01210 [Thermoplasmata archaeon]